jgi:hypothetical protein
MVAELDTGPNGVGGSVLLGTMLTKNAETADTANLRARLSSRLPQRARIQGTSPLKQCSIMAEKELDEHSSFRQEPYHAAEYNENPG